MSVADRLVSANAGLWERLANHPFVTGVADGKLAAAAFDRWLVEDHHFVVGFRRFLATVMSLAPDEPAREVLAGGLAALGPELALFRAEAAARGLDLDTEPSPTTLGYTAFVQAAPADGFEVALAVLYGAERAYFDAWSAVRHVSPPGSPYRAFVDNWSSPDFGQWVSGIAALVDGFIPDPPDAAVARAFARVVRFELRFWDAVHAGEVW